MIPYCTCSVEDGIVVFMNLAKIVGAWHAHLHLETEFDPHGHLMYL